MAKKLRALPKILVIEDSQLWNERLANMYCRILRQVDETIDLSSIPKACRQCSQTIKCFGIPQQEGSTKKPREELVKIARDASEALGYLEVSDTDLQLKKRNFDIISLDQNLGDGSTGDSLLRDATSEGRRVAVIAITGFRNDRSLQITMADRYDSIWNFRNHLESLSNGVCEVFEKSALVSDAIRVVRGLIDTTFSEDDNSLGRAHQIINKLEDANQNSEAYHRQIDEQVRRIEKSLSLGYLQDLVERTDRDNPLNLKDRLGLHIVIDDDVLPSNFPAWSFLASNNNTLQLGNLSVGQLNEIQIWKNKFVAMDDIGDLMKQLVTRLAFLTLDSSTEFFCSVVREGQDIMRMSPLHPIPKTKKEQNKEDVQENRPTQNPLAVLLIRLCVHKLLDSVKVDKDIGFFQEGLQRFGLAKPEIQNLLGGGKTYGIFNSLEQDFMTDGTTNLKIPKDVNVYQMSESEIEEFFKQTKKEFYEQTKTADSKRKKWSTKEIVDLRAMFAHPEDLDRNNPFYFYFGKNVTPRLYYNTTGKVRTSDPKYISHFLNPFLRRLFSTNDETIQKIDGVNIYKLKPQVCIYLHRSSSVFKKETVAWHAQLPDWAASSISMNDD